MIDGPFPDDLVRQSEQVTALANTASRTFRETGDRDAAIELLRLAREINERVIVRVEELGHSALLLGLHAVREEIDDALVDAKH